MSSMLSIVAYWQEKQDILGAAAGPGTFHVFVAAPTNCFFEMCASD